MHFELGQQTLQQALLWVLIAYLVVSLPVVWGSLFPAKVRWRSRSPELPAPPSKLALPDLRAAPALIPVPRQRSMAPRLRSGLGTLACGLLALWFGGFLASRTAADGRKTRPPPPHPSMTTRGIVRRPRPPPAIPLLQEPGRMLPIAAIPAAPRPHIRKPLMLAQAPPPVATAPPTKPVVAAEKPVRPYDPEEPTSVDFKNVDVKALLRFLAEKTRTNYFMDPAIQAKITVIGPNAIPLKDAIVFLEAALESRGFTVVDSGTFKEVVPKAKASGVGIPLYLEPAPSDGTPLSLERTVTEILPIRHAPVTEVKAAIQTLLPENSTALEHVPTNKLILTTTLRSLERLRRVIRELDVPIRGKRVHLLQITHRKAEDLAKQVTEVLAKEEIEKRIPQTKQEQAIKPALLADPTHNILVVVATDEDFKRIRLLVQKVDRDPDPGPEIQFIRVRHAEPSELVTKVTEALKGEGANSTLPAYTLVADERTQTIMLRTQSDNLRAQIVDAIGRLDEEGEPLDSARVRVYRLNFAEAEKVAELLEKIDFSVGPTAGPARPGAAAAALGSQDKVKIVADKNTNSLVLTAPRGLFDAIEAVIRQLDIGKPQVMVEVLIAEVDYDWARGAGLDFNFLNETSTNTNRPFGIGNLDNVEELLSGAGLPNGLSVGLIHGNEFDLGAAAGGDISELSKIAVLIRLFQGTSHANILSSPTLLTSDNEEARIAIGERILLPASFATAANTGLNSVTSFNSEDLGVILEITPRITRDDHVILKVDQQIKARTGDILGTLQTPVLSNREVSTNVNVRDGETVVIGGLLSEEETTSESRIPLLSAIPGLGKLFRSKSKSSKKTNLMIFLTPHILREDADTRAITETSRAEIATQIQGSEASRNSVIRRAFLPGRSLGRFRANQQQKKARKALQDELEASAEEGAAADSAGLTLPAPRKRTRPIQTQATASVVEDPAHFAPASEANPDADIDALVNQIAERLQVPRRNRRGSSGS